MLTAEQLDAMTPGTIFATGTAFDRPGELHMANTGRELRWVAVRGQGIPDWAIYTHFVENDADWVRRFGDKVQRDSHIRRLVPCDDGAFARYRY